MYDNIIEQFLSHFISRWYASWRKQLYPEKTTDLPQVTDLLSHPVRGLNS